MIGSTTRTAPIEAESDETRRVCADGANATTVSSPATKTWSAPRPRLLALVLVLVTLVAYQPTWRAGFISDDDATLTANPALTARHGLKMIWTKLAVGRSYPLTQTTFWVQRRLWGLHPLPYHLLNVLLHAANGVVLYFLLRQLRIPAAWLAAMVWALHPVNVESVAWITELKNTQSGLFFFLSLLFFLKFAEQKQRIIRWYSEYVAGLWYVAAFVCGLAAILSNAATAVLPLALLLAVRWQRGHWERADAVRLAPYFGMAWVVSGLTILEQYSQALSAGAAQWRLTYAERLVIAGKDLWFYAAKVLWPFRLAFVYPRWAVPASSVWSWVPIAALVALTVALWRRRGRAWCRAVLFAGGYFVAALLPVLGFFNIFFFRHSFVADHFQYLASVGIITLVCAGAATLWKRADLSAVALAKAEASCEGGWKRADLSAVAPSRRLVRRSFSEGGYVTAAAVAFLLTTLGTLTWSQARLYQNQETLWRDTIAKNPRSWLAHNSLGTVLVQQGMISDAIGQYDQALRIKPDSVETHCYLGYVFWKQGKNSDAIGQYEQALRIQPDLPQAHYNLAVVLEQDGRTEDAIAHYEQALQILPDYAEAHCNLGTLLLLEGKTSDAIGHYEEAVRIMPALPQLHYYLAMTLAQAGRTEDAVVHFEQALRLKPEYADAHFNLGNLFLQVGKTSAAIGQYEQAVRLEPAMPQVQYSLATALAQAGRFEDAVAHLEQALRIQPEYAEAHFNLGNLFLQEGKTSAAIGQYEQAARLEPELPQVHDGLATALAQAGRTEDAIAHLEQALQINPDYAEAHCNLGYVLLQEGKTSDAIRHYERALRIEPEFAQAHVGLGMALEREGRTEEAFAQFEQALWINPHLTQAQTALIQLHAPR
ncbi:MAG: tetratricopeptide repeat protein [Verrucomicrobiia bacterium]